MNPIESDMFARVILGSPYWYWVDTNGNPLDWIVCKIIRDGSGTLWIDGIGPEIMRLHDVIGTHVKIISEVEHPYLF